MALIQCPECESRVSNRAHACPQCGYPIAELTSFQDAIQHNRPEVVRDLIRAGYSMDEFDSQGKSPLMMASRLGTIEIAAILIEAGATIDLQRRDGSTALMDAVSNGHREIVGLLLNASADPVRENKEGHTALDIAIRKNKMNVLSLFQGEDHTTAVPPPLPEEFCIEKESDPPPNPVVTRAMPEQRVPENRDLFCKNCKSEISPDEIWCSHCKAPIIRRYCGGCKRLIPDIATKCPHCNSAKIGRFRYIRNLEQIMVSGALVALIAAVVGLYAPRHTLDAGAPAPLVPEHANQPLPPAQKDQVQAEAANPVLNRRPQPAVSATENAHRETADVKASTKKASTDAIEHSDPDLQGSADIQPDTVSWYGTAQRLNHAGYQLMQKGRYEEAIPLLNRSLQSFPTDARRNLTYAYALFNLGRSLRLVGRPDLAIPILKERLKYTDQREVVVRELALANQDLNSVPEPYTEN